MFGWFRPKRAEPEPRTLDLGPIQEFHAAPSGDGEQRLIAALRRLLPEHENVERAYLARVRYGEGQPLDMALCLVGTESDALYTALRKLFHAMFEQGQHLDIVFVSPDEEARLRSLSSSIYERS